MRCLFSVLVLALTVTLANAQSPQPYAGQQSRPVKALSEQQIADLREGRGMGMALAAELNGYPGPLHVLELAEPLQLSPDQHGRMQRLFDEMQAEARALGHRLIALETDLDQQFAGRTVTAASLAAATEAIGRTQAALRFAHLKAHLTTMEILGTDQVRRYQELRGYAGPSAVPSHSHHSRH